MTGDPISARIIFWEHTAGLGIAYRFNDGSGDAHAIGQDDWPIIKRLDHAGRLSFVRDELRERYYDAARSNANL